MNKSFEGGICLFFTRPATESRVFSGVSDSNLVKTMKAAVPESTQISHIEIVNKIWYSNKTIQEGEANGRTRYAVAQR